MADNNKKSKRRKPGTPPGASPVLVKLEDKINIIKSWEHETPENLPLFVMPEAIESDGYYFAAHSRSDFKIVYTDILELESVGVNIWYDRAMEPSKDWRELARRMMNRQECKGVIVYGTVNSMASEPVQTELLVADELGKNIIFINHGEDLKTTAAKDLYEEAKKSFGEDCACVERFEELLTRKGNPNITYIDLAVSPEKKKDKLDKIKPEEVLIYESMFKSASVVGVKYLGVKSVKIPKKVTMIIDEGESISKEECDVTKIGACAFANCRALEKIEFPETLGWIGEHAFFGCASLTKVNLGTNVRYVAENAFENCAKLEEVSVAGGNKHIIVKDRIYYGPQPHRDSYGIIFVPRDLEGGITLLDGLKQINEPAFRKCRGITSVTIPDSVTSIGWGAFSGCDSLTSVTIGNGVTSIGSRAFQKCTSLTSITIPDSVTSIGGSAFLYCRNLTSVTIGNGVTSIGVTSVTIGNGVTSIGDSAFWCCISLTSVTIPNSVTSIGDWAFSACDSLTSITIPDSVASIGENAFRFCWSLRHVTYSGTVRQWKKLTAKCPGWAGYCPCEVVKCKDGEAPVTAEDRGE